jgi:carboxymethylenebutenolidase
MKVAGMVIVALAVASTASAQQVPPPPPPAQAGAPGAGRGPQVPPIDVPWNDGIPAGTADHAARALKESTRHGEWVKIKLADGSDLNSWVVYPERRDKAGVVIVIHDINGMRDLPRAVGDQLAQDGFIAIVPDFVSGKGPNGGGSDSLGTGVNAAISGLPGPEAIARLNAAMEYGKKLPASNGKTGVIGFCWGGARSFAYAAAQPNLNASVVYYGEAPGSGDGTLETALANLKAPVLGLYAGNDARIGMTVPDTDAAMKKLGKSYESHFYEGAGHGFMGAQAGAAGANLKAAQESWPLVVAFFTKNLK